MKIEDLFFFFFLGGLIFNFFTFRPETILILFFENFRLVLFFYRFESSRQLFVLSLSSFLWNPLPFTGFFYFDNLIFTLILFFFFFLLFDILQLLLLLHEVMGVGDRRVVYEIRHFPISVSAPRSGESLWFLHFIIMIGNLGLLAKYEAIFIPLLNLENK